MLHQDDCKTVVELLSPKVRWTKGTFARIGDRMNSLDGPAVRSDDPCATCFCLLGAVHRVYHTEAKRDAAILKLHIALEATGWPVDLVKYAPTDDLVNWNDAEERTHEEVLALAVAAGV